MTSESKKILGSGHLFIDEEGYKLKIINSNPPSRDDEAENLLSSMLADPGKWEIRSIADYCYSLKAQDNHGNEYSCDYVDAGSISNSIIYTCSLKSKLIVTSDKDTLQEFFHASVVFKNKYSFDTNNQDYQKAVLPTLLDESGHWKHAWKFNIGGISLILYKDTKMLHLDIHSEEAELNDEIIKRIVDSLDFAMGLSHDEYFVVFFDKNDSFRTLINTDVRKPAATLLTAPYQKNGSMGDEATYNSKLVTAYYNHLNSFPDCILPKLHKRVIDSGSGYYYRHGLILGIVIEKILRTYYPKPTEVISQQMLMDINQISQLVPKLSDSGVIARIKTLIADLSNTQNYVPAKMLRNLEDQQTIGSGSVTSWKKLRNLYAHGDDLNDELSKAVGLVRHNITIYYELIFNIINYRGRYTSYSAVTGNSYKYYPLMEKQESEID
ncbi:hypothetical protein WG906_03080 [Pedobacter sp. P351]|uniref:hypothetical protein n=1 Tax=Pedobacter superstes TaxID=3133441 RepID=UPI00309DFF80